MDKKRRRQYCVSFQQKVLRLGTDRHSYDLSSGSCGPLAWMLLGSTATITSFLLFHFRASCPSDPVSFFCGLLLSFSFFSFIIGWTETFLLLKYFAIL
ncbi:hypothetical protein AVEN_189531-1 [Araneus ventricosus]|uniref:Uncharacterized protein n=1 Tax=Araneus ventricosus TaxID=182803 RepID=A0A4Y2GMT6_ARAVE|nr:hypothetical protein AVEN_189531-1 [Araneus ventricosus]